jgi:hypothetical protein
MKFSAKHIFCLSLLACQKDQLNLSEDGLCARLTLLAGLRGCMSHTEGAAHWAQPIVNRAVQVDCVVNKATELTPCQWILFQSKLI